MIDLSDQWETTQNILVILAHPDDPEFFCGATLARWVQGGHQIDYLILTCGEKGGDINSIPSELCSTRTIEQHNASKIIGIRSVKFLDQEDGYLIPSLILRREIVRAIRSYRPDIIVTCDPSYLFPATGYGINHPDHRAAGQVVMDAVYPAAGNVHYFPELLKENQLKPHSPREIWLSLTGNPNVIIDVTNLVELKIAALLEHKSQIGDPEKFLSRMRARHTEDSTDDSPRYVENFRVIRFRLS